MQTRRLGRTDLSIAPLVLGGNVFGWTADKKTSFDGARPLRSRRASTRSTRPTSIRPGRRAIQGANRDDHRRVDEGAGKSQPNVIVITKVGSPMGKGKEGLKARYIEEAVEASLKRLQTDVIDLYLSHWPDMATPIEETLGAYQRLIEKGKIRWCGASNLSVKLLEAALAAAKAKGLPRYEVLQPEYNLADRHEFEGGLADLCQREEIGVITYFSLAKGFLSGKYRSEADLAKSPRGERGQGLSQSARISHPRRARSGRGAPQSQAGRSRARLGHGEARRHRADRQRHLGRTGRQPRARDRACADGSRHGRAQRGERALRHDAIDLSRRRGA